MVVLHLPASGQLKLFVGEHVEKGHQIPVVLVALKVVSIPTNLTDHMLQTRVGGEHTVGTLREKEMVEDREREAGTGGQNFTGQRKEETHPPEKGDKFCKVKLLHCGSMYLPSITIIKYVVYVCVKIISVGRGAEDHSR